MFTGIVSAIGQVTKIVELGKSDNFGNRYWLQAPQEYLDDVKIGDSIAINGACMTVLDFSLADNNFVIDMSAESIAKTVALQLHQYVNLEKAMRVDDRLGGHIVSGHVDGKGQIRQFTPIGESIQLVVACAKSLQSFFVYKGSVTINGVSLTVNQVVDNADEVLISINLIEHTVQNSALQYLKQGDWVNVEVDTIARYLQRMLSLMQIS